MNYHTYFARVGGVSPVECAIVGTGGFGRSFLFQSRKLPLLNTRIAIDVAAETARQALLVVGVSADQIAICDTVEQALAAWQAGQFIACNSLAIVLDLPFGVLVEATGHPEAGAGHVARAIEAGKHVALVSKEIDSVVGPGLAKRAVDIGCIVSPVDGDQPSLLIGLITWAQVLGFEIIAAGKSSEYDFVYDPATGQLSSNGVTISAPGFADCLALAGSTCHELAQQRASLAATLPQRAVPDLCELSVVANATGFMPDRADLHAPIARIGEVADFFSLQSQGGLLSAPGRLDVFHCLRLPDEVSFAGGVFVVVRCEDAAVWQMLADKGHVVSSTGETALIYLPRHLLGLEAATSVLEMGLLNVSSGGAQPAHHVDLVAYADADLTAGTVLQMGGHHHSITSVSARLVAARALSKDAAVPFYLAANRALLRDVRKGEPILCSDVDIDQTGNLFTLRLQQDAWFHPPAAVPADLLG